MSGAFDPQYAPQEPMVCMWPLGHRNRPHRRDCVCVRLRGHDGPHQCRAEASLIAAEADRQGSGPAAAAGEVTRTPGSAPAATIVPGVSADREAAAGSAPRSGAPGTPVGGAG